MSVQLNVRTTPVLIGELDKLVKKGYFRNRTEAVNEAIRFLIRRYHTMNSEGGMNRVSKKNKGVVSVTKDVVRSYAKED